MSSTTATDDHSLTRQRANTLFGQTMGLVALTAVAFAFGAYLARDVSQGWNWVFFIAGFGCLIAMSAATQRSDAAATWLLLGFGALTGAAIAPTIAYYGSTDPKPLWESGAATALFIAGFGAAGYATRRDLSAMARTLWWALIALIVFGFVVDLVQIPSGDVIFAVIGLVIFAGWTSYDFQRLRRSKDIRSAPLLAASIFLDIFNVFLLFLTFFDGNE